MRFAYWRCGRGMGITVVFRGQAENKRRENENNDAFFFPRKNKPLLELVEFPA
jgi:hypothetical protein